MNDKASQSFILNRMGMAAYFLEDVSKAIGYYEQSLVIARALEDRDSESVALFNIGDAHHLANDVAKAIPCYKDALALNMPSTNYKCALGLGVAFRQMGQQQEARSHFEHCIRLLSVIPTTSLAFHPQLAALGVSLLAVGRAEEGLELYRQGLELAPLREYLHYAIQDLRLLQRVPPLVPGVTEAIKLLEGAVSTSTESVT
jgi:tetratricopeptide (TPR) repeat protein